MAVINTYYDKTFFFYLNVRGGNVGKIDVTSLMNLLWDENSNNLKFGDKPVQSPSDPRYITDAFPCIIIIPWSDIINKINERLETVSFYNEILDKIIEKRGGTTVTNAYKSSFETELERLNKLLKVINKDLEFFEQKLYSRYSFFNNSSIWLRLVIKNGDGDDEKIAKAKNELEYFNRIGLYDYGSAKENLEYNIRVQSHNYLDTTSGGHGEYVTPVLYGNEVEHWNILFKDNKIEKK